MTASLYPSNANRISFKVIGYQAHRAVRLNPPKLIWKSVGGPDRKQSSQAGNQARDKVVSPEWGRSQGGQAIIVDSFWTAKYLLGWWLQVGSALVAEGNEETNGASNEFKLDTTWLKNENNYIPTQDNA